MFNDKYSLTQAVLDGRKTMTRRVCKYDRPNETYDIVFPVFEPNDYDNDGNIVSPLNYAFGWKNDKGDFTGWNIPKYKVGEVVAIAQSYSDCGNMPDYELGEDGYPIMPKRSGFFNKMFVRADLMPHHIRITDIKIERLQNISDEDCFKEGIFKWDTGQKDIPFYSFHNADIPDYNDSRDAFAELIDKVSGKGTWASNPYAFVYEFELID
ncbi:MAG: ASCH domain protein [Bacteriophage sp.]|nr:MAG: ASCH domain protein [Bacteriophage sp.]